MYLSIVVPVYNVEKYIKECLDSIVPQIENRDDVEIIIVNDGTKDNSMDIVQMYLNRSAIIKIINQQNQGLSQARNKGLSESKADYVWFVDSDDYLKDGAIKYFLSISKENNNIDVFASYMDRYIESENRYIKNRNTGSILWEGPEYLFKGMPKGAAQRFIYKRKFLLDNELSFMPGILHEDGVWGCKMLYCAEHVYFLPDSVYVYRLRSNGSIMSNIKIKSAYDLILGHKELMTFLNKRVKSEHYLNFRKYIFTQIVCAFGYTKPLFKTEEFKTFYNLNEEYIIGEARWLMSHRALNISIVSVSLSPKLLMGLMKFRYHVLKLFKH